MCIRRLIRHQDNGNMSIRFIACFAYYYVIQYCAYEPGTTWFPRDWRCVEELLDKGPDAFAASGICKELTPILEVRM